MATAIKDYSLKLGFDNSAVIKGLQKIEKLLNKTTKAYNRATSTIKLKEQNQALREQIRLVKQQSRQKASAAKQAQDAIKKETQLIRAKNRLERRIMEAERVGIDKSKLGTYYSALKRGKDPAKFARTEAKLVSLITKQKKEQLSISKQEASVKEKLYTSESAKVRSLSNRIKTLIDKTDRQIAAITLSPKAAKSKEGQEILSHLQRRRESLAGNLTALSGAISLRALHDLEDAYRATARSASALSPHINSVTRKLTAQQFAARSLKRSLRNMADSYLSIFAVVAGVAGSYNIGEKLESVQASFLAASGDQKQAIKDWEFVEKVAKSMGGSLPILANGYQKIATSALAMDFSHRQAKDTFLAGVEASKAFGLSVDDTGGVLRALDQIMSKSTVQLEELKGQLGDRLPGALAIAAKAMGKTTDELTDMIKRGELSAKEFIPKFTAEIRKMVRETGALKAAMNSVKTSREVLVSTFQTKLFVSFTKAKGGVKSFFDSLAKMLLENTALFDVFGRITNIVLKSFSAVLDPITTGFKVLGETLKVVFDIIENGHNAATLRQTFDGVGIAIKGVVWAVLTLIGYWYKFLSVVVGEDGSREKLRKAFDDMFGKPIEQAKQFLSDLNNIVSFLSEAVNWVKELNKEYDKFSSNPFNELLTGGPVFGLAKSAYNFMFRDKETAPVTVNIDKMEIPEGSDGKDIGRNFGLGLAEGLAASGGATGD